MSQSRKPQDDHHDQELRIQRQVAFASGIFQGDITVRTLLESMAEGVVIIDESGTVLLINGRAEQMFGYSRQELIGKPHAVLIPELSRGPHEERQAGYFAEPKIRPMGLLLDLSGRRRDGSTFPLEISLSYIETINGVLVLAFISDITLRKQYEAHLQESQKLFHILVEGVKDYAIFMLDPSGYILSWNEGAQRLKGYRAEEIIGKHVSCCYSEDDRAAGKPERLLKQAAAVGRFEDEGWLIRKDGSRFWANVILTALRDEKGDLRGFTKVTRDITERKKAEDALRFSESRYRALFRDNPTMIFTLDSDGVILSVNPFMANQLGYAIHEMEGRSVLILFHEDDHPAVLRHLQTCLQAPGQVYHWQISKIRKDGKRLWVEETAQAVSGMNGVPNVLIVCQDVTERRQAEDALRKSELKLSRIFHTVPAIIGITTVTEGRCIDINEQGLRTLGYRREEMIGRTMLELGVWESRGARETMLHVLEKEGMVRDMEVSLRGKGGRVFTGLFSAEEITLDGERYLLSIIKDITDRKRMEEEIERLNTDLALRAAELEAANRELEAFNYTVAHDLRKPLSVVNGYCQALKELCSDRLDAECIGYIHEAYEGTWRMNRLIDALLNFSRLAHVELRHEPVDLSLMAHQVAEELKLAEPVRRVKFLIPDGVRVEGDPGLLRVVLDNLFGNAWKFTAIREEGVIQFGMKRVGGMEACFIRDNGPGFESAQAGKIFIPFQRLPGAEQFRGHGIGLATVDRIVRRHGGRVWAEGAPGEGATFYFTLAP